MREENSPLLQAAIFERKPLKKARIKLDFPFRYFSESKLT